MLSGLLVIAAIAVSYVARKSTLEETTTTALPVTVPDDVDVRSIAVLPFASFSAESGQDWFAAGMHEALLTALQQIGALRVTSRTSALRYRETGLLLPEVARELGVRWLVEGSVVRAQNRVRITAQLVDGPSDHQIWAEQYERDVADMLSLQTEVARAIASRINATITPEEERRLSEVRRVNPEAYGAYVRGLHHFDRITPADFLMSEQSFREAIALDPGFAPAHAALAVTYGIAIEYGWLPRVRAGPLAEAAARSAMRLDPGLGDSHHALARVRFHVERDFAAAEGEFRRALELQYNAYVLFGYGWLLSQMGRHEEAIRTLERAVNLDPRSALMHGDLGWWLYGGGYYERAIEEANVAIQLDADYPEGHWLLAAAYAQQGRHTEALQAFARYEAMYGEPVYWFRGYLLGLAGQREEALAALTELEKLVEQGKAPTVQLAQIHLGRADYEAVLDVLERSSEAGVSFQPYLWPEYRVLFTDARFRALLENFRLPLPSQP